MITEPELTRRIIADTGSADAFTILVYGSSSPNGLTQNVTTLSRELGMTQARVRKALSILAEKNMVYRSDWRDGQRNRTHYTFVYPES